MLSNNNCNDASYNVSTNVCQVLGIKKKLVSFEWFKFELKKRTIALKNTNTKKFTNTKLVIEKSKQNNLMENNKII